MKLRTTMRLIAAGALFCSATVFEVQAASFLITNVTQWTGPEAGVGVSQAVMVIQWPGQINGFAWGYRWQSSESKTGADMLAAFANSSNGAFVVTGGGYINNLQWQGNSFPGYNPSTGAFLNYFVNNEQSLNPDESPNYENGAAPAGAHILPPLGSPYDEGGPGRWVSSNTGVSGRPLVDGSWDGWVYGAADVEMGPSLAVNAPAPIPEPSSTLLIACGSLVLFRRKRVA